MSYIQIQDDDVRKTFNLAAQRLVNTEPLAADIERILVSQSLQNFQANGRPKWAGLSPVTLAIYSKRGIKPQGILQISGALRDSVQGDHDNESVTIGAGSGASAAYAAIHMFGGQAGRGHKVKIPARPYLPFLNGYLQPEAETAVSFVASHYLSKLFD